MDTETQVEELDERVEPESSPVVDLNQATAEELEALAGIGPSLAQRIVAYREEQGDFRSPDGLTAVPGIGCAAYERLADRLTVVSPETSPTTDEAPLAEASEAAPLPPEEVAAEAAGAPETPPIPEAEEEALGEERISEAEAVSPAEDAPAHPPAETAAAPPAPATLHRPFRTSYLAWLGAALAGGILGMVFALLVFYGINGALDLSGSRAVLDVQNQMDNLAAEVDSQQQKIDGLDRRLKTLEGLTARMEKAESAVDALRQETADLGQRAETLESELTGVSETLSEVQAQSQQMTTFFGRLQALLQEVFGDQEMVEPTPESPVETPTPTQ